MFQETILDAIEDSITWPVRKIIPILPGDYRFLLLYIIPYEFTFSEDNIYVNLKCVLK